MKKQQSEYRRDWRRSPFAVSESGLTPPGYTRTTRPDGIRQLPDTLRNCLRQLYTTNRFNPQKRQCGACTRTVYATVETCSGPIGFQRAPRDNSTPRAASEQGHTALHHPVIGSGTFGAAEQRQHGMPFVLNSSLSWDHTSAFFAWLQSFLWFFVPCLSVFLRARIAAIEVAKSSGGTMSFIAFIPCSISSSSSMV